MAIDIKFDFKNNVGKFYSKLGNNSDRYLSWEHCYLFFYKYKNNPKEIDLDLAALNLAFYLASWGMYRGSSFLLQYDYKIHKEMIGELVDECRILWNDYSEISWDAVNKANEIIKKHYKKFSKKDNISETLTTKVLMGIFACTPAYDRFFKDGIKRYNKENHTRISASYSKNSYNQLKDFISSCGDNCNLVLRSNSEISYPKMKLIDMYFWQIGFSNSFKAVQLDENKKEIILLNKITGLKSNEYVLLGDVNSNTFACVENDWTYSSNEDEEVISPDWLKSFIDRLILKHK